jgi:hypothetical protein
MIPRIRLRKSDELERKVSCESTQTGYLLLGSEINEMNP